jgi:hypothetical protein
MSTGKTVDLILIKAEMARYISTADARILSQLGYVLLDREISEDSIQDDLGSEVIESLLDEIESAGYERLKEIHTALKEQGIIK